MQEVHGSMLHWVSVPIPTKWNGYMSISFVLFTLNHHEIISVTEHAYPSEVLYLRSFSHYRPITEKGTISRASSYDRMNRSVLGSLRNFLWSGQDHLHSIGHLRWHLGVNRKQQRPSSWMEVGFGMFLLMVGFLSMATWMNLEYPSERSPMSRLRPQALISPNPSDQTFTNCARRLTSWKGHGPLTVWSQAAQPMAGTARRCYVSFDQSSGQGPCHSIFAESSWQMSVAGVRKTGFKDHPATVYIYIYYIPVYTVCILILLHISMFSAQEPTTIIETTQFII